jgi:outer membrane protein OmpA-like peptidoglycan-associated protein
VVLARFVDGLPLQVEGNLLFSFRDALIVGGGYRMADVSNVSLTAGLRLKKRFCVFYSLESGAGNTASLGMTHEVSVAYRFGGKSKEMELIEELQKRADKTDRRQRELTTRMDTAEAKVQQLQESDSLQNIRIDDNKKELDNRVKAMEDKFSAYEKEMKEIRELLNNAKSAFRFKYENAGRINFKVASDNLDAKAKKGLDAVFSTYLNGYDAEKTIVYLMGRASQEGDNTYNLELSIRRAAAVRDYLVKTHKVDPNRIILLPYGEEAPVTDKQTTGPEREANRCVDIILSGAAK